MLISTHARCKFGVTCSMCVTSQDCTPVVIVLFQLAPIYYTSLRIRANLSPSYLSRLLPHCQPTTTHVPHPPINLTSLWQVPLLAKKHSALLVLWLGHPSQAMFEFAGIIPHSVNCAVHDQFLLHEYCTYMKPEYIPLALLHVLMTLSF